MSDAARYLREQLVKVTSERDRFALSCVDLKGKAGSHEEVHALSHAALNDLRAKNEALEQELLRLSTRVTKLREVLKAHKHAPMMPGLNPIVVRVTLMGMTDRVLAETE